LKISVALSYNIFEPLTYQTSAAAGAGLKIGMRVLVPLGSRIVPGWVLNLDSPYKGRMKNIIGVIDDLFYPDEAFLEFARQSAVAYFTSVGVVLDHALPASKRNLKKLCLELNGQINKITDFSQGQLEKMAATEALRFFFKKGSASPAAVTIAAASSAVSPVRLVLDSGRGRDYQEISQTVLGGGQSVLLLVPDNASARYWKTIWPEMDIYNSETRPAARENIWAQYQQGKNGMVCGGLAAVFLPMTNLGLLIVDRATSPLYQRTFHSPYKTDYLARIRSQAGRIPLLQGAASHSCTTYQQRENIAMTDRRHDRGLSFQVHMLKGKDRGIPAALIQLINQNFLQKKKTLILVNKIQPARNLFCDNCGKIVACPSCGGILQVDEPQQAACRRCSFRQEHLAACPRCQKNLTLLHDISLESLARTIERHVSEKSILTLSAASLKDMEQILPAVQASSIVIATPAALNPFFKEIFASVIYIKPESFFGMDEFNSAEMIYTTAAEIVEVLVPGGDLHVFSVFHFHYALQFLLDEDKFFERELKYRQWFMLPPFGNVYQLEIRNDTLRSLAGTMRDLHKKHKIELQIKKIYLISRQPLRGTYRGVLELHASAEKIIAAGLQQIKKSSLSLLAG
jgi:primosomal protein N'